ncbi:hypothetical protein AAH174_16055 [Bacteroides thetaiotaomicron]|uniref:hypothetical protein n=1 Tax=Bacteroides thetaiotaomicron TaxID=818 RepID=UPI0039B5DEC3
MNAIGLNPIKLDAIGLDPIRMNAIRLGVPGASSDSARPYIDPELLSHVKMAISTWGKTNDDPDRAILKDLTPNGNNMRLLNFGFAEGSGYGLPGTDFEGWLCTDGIDDLIVSVKPVSEMLEGSNEITVLSIIHQIKINDSATVTNDIRNTNIASTSRNAVKVDGKTGIYGYSRKGTDDCVLINNILGDKTDYTVTSGPTVNYNNLFSVVGTQYGDYNSQIAYAGGFIANKVLTTDEINQIIAYFNLDRPGQIIKPQLYCNIKKQGITNDNHAEFNDQLIDFVGGRNIQLNNVAWEGESGIGSYPVVLGINKTFRFGTQWEVSNSGAKMSCVDIVDISLYSLYYNVKNPEGGVITTEIPSFTIKVSGITDGSFGYLRYGYLAAPDAVAITEFRMTADGTYTLPKCYGGSEALDKSKSCYVGFSVEKANVPGSLIIEVLPTIENALCLDGINDFGKSIGLPILKDYTVVADREIETSKGGIVSKDNPDGAFICEITGEAYSYGAATSVSVDFKRKLSYQSKYIYNGSPIQAGTGVDTDSMWLGTIRDGDSRFSKIALWSLMLFPYSLSEFLLERQLRKYKAGTLYPDMVEFRPIVKSNIPYSSISYSVNPGVYVAEGSMITITITLSNASDKLIGVSSNAISDISISGDNGVYEVTGKVTKSPQKISIVISSYLTMLSNSTLISNETLIKNE